MGFTVKKIISGDEFETLPPWSWNKQEGSVVIVKGYAVPEGEASGVEPAQDILERIILNKEVELKNPVRITDGRLLCEVYIEGQNIASYFPDYQA